MNILQSKMRLIVWVVVIVAVAGIFAFIWLHGAPAPASPVSGTPSSTTPQANAAGNGAMTTTVTGSTGTPTPTPVTSGSKGSPAPLPPTAITISLITPVSGNTWTIGQNSSIAWSKAARVTGEIDLINAQTKAFVGVILSETGPNQTSYAWDARSIYAARYSAEKHDVVPGTYAIRIRFDGNGFGSLVSGPVTIQN